jgi:predicted extracellular nuclease
MTFSFPSPWRTPRLYPAPYSGMPALRGLAAVAFGLLSLSATAASSVVISQVYGGGGNAGALYKNDFIEIFNRDAAPVNLNGWSVQYAAATGTSWTVTPLPNVTLQAGQYLLVQEAIGAGGTTTLPAPEGSGNIALSATAGKVVLANTTAAVASASAPGVMDLVGFGSTANAFEGAGPSAAPSNTSAILRAGNGCTDTDDNASNFTAAAPTPRNGSTALNVCGSAANAPIVTQCPENFSVPAGAGGATTVSASDADGAVTAASILSGAVAGIALNPINLPTAPGASATFSVSASATVPVGSYALTLRFSNDQTQLAQCLLTLNVQAAAVTSHTIPQIQGSGASSAYVGTMQTTEGVVTLVVFNGFYLQDPLGDGDPSTSDGIFVFTGAAPTVTTGDRVRLSATVAEFLAGDAARTVTQLTGVSGLVVLSRNNSVTPTDIALPLASAADFERYEGMLVRHAAPLTVSQNYFQGRYGQVSLSAGRLEKPTNRYPARSAQAVTAAAANAANLLVLDDRLTSQNPNPIPYIGADNTLRAGDTVNGLTGVIDFGLVTASNPGPSGYKLQPSVTPVFSRENARTAAPLVPLGNVKVASFNVLNYFTTFTDGTTAAGLSGQGCSLGASVTRSNCRGADNLAEFQRQRAKIVSAMAAINADVFGLMEIQNNGDVAAANLVAALNSAVGANTYAVVPQPTTSGATGTDAIRVAMIYKPSQLTLVGAALADPDPINNRPPMAQTFAAGNGQKFSLIVNHLKSKGSCPAAGDLDADSGDGQGCWNATRVNQAQRLAGVFVPQVQAAANDPDVLLIGDLNAYGFEDPVNRLTANGFVNQVERFLRRSGLPYSYVFDGEAGYIDHALASAALSAQVLGVNEWHINADEPSVIDYNTEFKPQDLYTASPYRSSDHDPVVVSLNLQSSVVDVTGRLSLLSSGVVFNRATQTDNTTLSLTNSSGAFISGPLQVELRNLPAGVTLANSSGLHNGLPTVTVAPGNLTPGQTVTVPLNFRNPSKVTLSYVPRVYSGNF